jgi:hypothetical protein
MAKIIFMKQEILRAENINKDIKLKSVKMLEHEINLIGTKDKQIIHKVINPTPKKKPRWTYSWRQEDDMEERIETTEIIHINMYDTCFPKKGFFYNQ